MIGNLSLFVSVLLSAISASSAVKSPVPFESPKYGIKAHLPASWEVVAREEEDIIFLARIPQEDPDRPGGLACELALAPESLEEYRTRINANAERGRSPGKLVRNEIVEVDGQRRLETHHEFRPPLGGVWHEWNVRVLADRLEHGEGPSGPVSVTFETTAAA